MVAGSNKVVALLLEKGAQGVFDGLARKLIELITRSVLVGRRDGIGHDLAFYRD